MSSPSDIISLLRASSMPIHKKLDSIGISSYLKNGTLDQNVYRSWLELTYNFLVRVEQIMTANKGRLEGLDSFVPSDLGLEFLEQDLSLMNPNWKSPNVNQNHSPIHSDLIIVPVYTLLGSLMGSEIIYTYVKRKLPNSSTLYLEHIQSHKKHWPAFLGFLKTKKLTIQEGYFTDYVVEFWTEIYEEYKMMFSK